MAKYKKRDVKHSRKKVKNAVTRDVVMKPANSSRKENKTLKTNKSQNLKPQKPEKIKVIKGNRPKIKKRRMIVISLCLLLVAAFVIVLTIIPTSFGEFIENTVAFSGSGSGFPVTLGGGSISDVLSGDNCFIVASQTNVSGYNNSGKEVFSYQHGYEIPVVKNSPARFMLYSQGGTEYSVYNFNKNLYTQKTDNPILAANLSRNGYFAVATQSDSYTSQVTVYDDDAKQIYKWFCSDYIINDLVLSADGETLALSVFNTQNGVYNSKIYILKYDSATPVKLFEFNNDLIVSLRNFDSNGFYAVFGNKTEFIKWKSFESTAETFEKNIIFSRGDSDNSVIVTCREANVNDNTVYIFDDKGTQKGSFEFSSEINDIILKGKYIYILSDRKIYVYNLKCEKLNTKDCDFGIERIVPVGNFKVAVINDNLMEKIEF